MYMEFKDGEAARADGGNGDSLATQRLTVSAQVQAESQVAGGPGTPSALPQYFLRTTLLHQILQEQKTSTLTTAVYLHESSSFQTCQSQTFIVYICDAVIQMNQIVYS